MVFVPITTTMAGARTAGSTSKIVLVIVTVFMVYSACIVIVRAVKAVLGALAAIQTANAKR